LGRKPDLEQARAIPVAKVYYIFCSRDPLQSQLGMGAGLSTGDRIPRQTDEAAEVLLLIRGNHQE
jgi:hypothetical protein